MIGKYKQLDEQYAKAVNEGWFDMALKVISDAKDWIHDAVHRGTVTDGWAHVHDKKWDHRAVFVLDNVMTEDVDEDLGRGH